MLPFADWPLSRANKRERACNSRIVLVLDGEIKSVTKNSNAKLELIVYWRSMLRISNFSVAINSVSLIIV